MPGTAGGTRLAQRVRLAMGLRAFLSEPLTLDAALTQIGTRLEQRDRRFLAVVRQLVYERPASPYRALLLWAGCELGDLEASVRSDGVEGTLETLRAQGVRLSLEEFKSRTPIERPGLLLETTPRDFDNPIFLGRAMAGATSGSSGRSTRVFLDWDGLAEESANELVLYASHGLQEAPLALWLPPPPGLAGIRNVLVHAKLGRAPSRWFSPTPWSSRRHRLATHALLSTCRVLGARVPRPEPVDPGDALEVAAWLAEGRVRGETRVLSAFTSAVVRVASAAAEHGLDLGGDVVFATGEALTVRRREHIEQTGLRAFARYVAAETGMVAGGCGRRDGPDGMHLYLDRLAAIPAATGEEDALLLTTLSQGTPKVLLNVDLGDRFRLERRACGCLLGELGMDVHLSHVRSSTRLTNEGGTVLVAELAEIVGSLVERAGGGPDDAQLVERQDSRGLISLEIAVDDRLSIDADALVDGVLAEMVRRGAGERTMAELWREAGTLTVTRAAPQRTSGGKLPQLVSTDAE